MYLILREVVGRFYEMFFNDASFFGSGVSLTLGLLMFRRTMSVFLRVYITLAVQLVFMSLERWFLFGLGFGFGIFLADSLRFY